LQKHPIKRDQPLHALLFKEVSCFNRLISEIKKSLNEIQLAIKVRTPHSKEDEEEFCSKAMKFSQQQQQQQQKGFEAMSPEMESTYFDLLLGVIPKAWKQHSYLRFGRRRAN
jgi:hypothetical protein